MGVNNSTMFVPQLLFTAKSTRSICYARLLYNGYNSKQGSQSLVVSTTWNTLSSGVANRKEKEGRQEWALLSRRISSQS